MEPIHDATAGTLPGDKFALPSGRTYPIHDAAHARDAIARLEQNRGRIVRSRIQWKPDADILDATERFRIEARTARR